MSNKSVLESEFPELHSYIKEQAAVVYVPQYREYGILVHDGGTSFIEIHYCPWTGKKLPSSLRDEWFDTLEKMGIEEPDDPKIPKEMQSEKWWIERGL